MSDGITDSEFWNTTNEVPRRPAQCEVAVPLEIVRLRAALREIETLETKISERMKLYITEGHSAISPVVLELSALESYVGALKFKLR